MGFSSFLDSKTKQSIPAYPYTNLPKELSYVRVIFSDNSFIEGYYDGYGSLHENPYYQAYCSKDTADKYHEDQAKRLHLWDVLESKGMLKSEDCFKDQKEHMRIVVKMNYNGEKFEDLKTLSFCKDQGYFYSPRTREKLLKSFLKY